MHKYESVDSDDIDIDEKFFDIKMNVSGKIYNTLKNNKGFLDSNGFVPSSRSFFSVLEKNSFSRPCCTTKKNLNSPHQPDH